MVEFKNVAYDFKQKELKNEVRIVHDVSKSEYDILKRDGESDENIQNALKELIRNVRFFDDESGYIFILKYDGSYVLFPPKSHLEGKNVNYIKDKNWVYVIQELVKVAKKGGGIVLYLWPKKKDGEPQLKLNYVLSSEPYGWAVGAGVYVAQINGISTQNARSLEEIAGVAEHMNKMTETLNNKLSEVRT